MDLEKLTEDLDKNGEGSDLTPSFFEFNEPGATVIGFYITHIKVRSKRNEGEYNQYILDTTNGRVKFNLGVVTDKAIESSLVPGHLMKFTFNKKVPIGGGQTVNDFTVKDYGAIRSDTIEQIPF